MLGPILGHTTDTTTRIWIAADGGPHRLEVEGGSTVPFRPTEAGVPEFGTAIADATGLAPDTRYRYVVRSPDGVVAARGSIHTFPLQWDRTDLLFASASCDSLHVAGDRSSPGAWDLLARRMRRGDLRFPHAARRSGLHGRDGRPLVPTARPRPARATAPHGRGLPPLLVTRSGRRDPCQRAHLHDVGRPRDPQRMGFGPRR